MKARPKDGSPSGGTIPDRTVSLEPGITCQPLDDGGWHIHLAAARRKPIAPTVAGLLLTGIAVALFLAPSPYLMRIITISLGVCVLFPGAVFDYIAIYLWLVSQDVRVRRGSLVMERRASFFHWGRTFYPSDIAQIICRIDGTSSTNGNEKTYYGVELKTSDGKSIWLASNISQEACAVRLTEAINGALGLVY